MKILLSTAMMVLVLCLPLVSPAADLSGRSRTYLLYRETLDNKKLMPIYEYLDFKAENVAQENISLHFGGWLRYDLKSAPSGTRSESALQYGYLSYRAARANTSVDLGRLFVYEGAATAQVDGIHARTDLVGGLSAAAFGGIPVKVELNGRSGDSVYGGRVGQATNFSRIGLSYLKEKDDHSDFRKEEGVDLWLRPFSVIELLGTSSYNAITREWMQHAYHLTLTPLDRFVLATDLNRIVYKDFFKASTTSVFKLQAGVIDPNERMSSVGETASYTIGKATLSLNYTAYTYDIAGNAKAYGAQADFIGSSAGAGLGLQRMNGDTDPLQYTSYRVYASTRAGNADVTVDALAISYDVPINSVKNAYSASLAGGYAMTPRAKVIADIEYSHNPFYDQDVRGMVQLVYKFDSAAGPKGGK